MSSRTPPGPSRWPVHSRRAVAPVVGVVLLVALATVLAGVTAAALAGPTVTPSPPTVALSATVDGATDRVTVIHDGGDPLDPAALGLRLTVDGAPVAHQPRLPSFAVRGYHGGPAGPFNDEFDGRWTAGERATLRLAETNTDVEPGDVVGLHLSYRGERLAVLEVRAR